MASHSAGGRRSVAASLVAPRRHGEHGAESYQMSSYDFAPTTRRELCASAAIGMAALLAHQNAHAAEAAGTLAVKADLLYTASGVPIHNAVVLIKNGKIASVGSNLQIPNGVRTLHAAVAMPGMVDPHSYLGCYYEGSEPVDAVTPDFRIVDGFDPTDPMISATVQAGVTTAAIMPGNGS